MKTKLPNKGVRKNLEKRNKKIMAPTSKKGTALAETVLLTAISVVIILAIFYPEITAIFKNAIANVETWFNQAISTIGVIK